MTEDEAKTKWCPHRRLTEIGNVRVTNIDPGIRTLNCIGAYCMTWRTDRRRNVPTGKDIIVKDSAGLNHVERETRVELDGHCGLAGSS